MHRKENEKRRSASVNEKDTVFFKGSSSEATHGNSQQGPVTEAVLLTQTKPPATAGDLSRPQQDRPAGALT